MAGSLFINTAVSPITETVVLEVDPNSVLDNLPPFVYNQQNVNDFHDDQPFPTVTSADTSAQRFEALGLSDRVLKGLIYAENKLRPSKLQSISLPLILAPPHNNLIAQASIGSGKSFCAVLAMLSRVDPNLPAPQAICICPTRELANQILDLLLKLGMFSGIISELAIQATDEANYIRLSKRALVTAQVIIGTPSTINKWIAAKKLSTSYLKILVFDDADHMLAEDGLKEDSVRIMKDIVKWSPKCQVLLFSATFNDTVTAFVSKIVNHYFVRGYNQLLVKEEEGSLDSVKQYKISVPDELAKITVIKYFIMDLGDKIRQTIIFVKTKKSAGMLHEALVKFGYDVTTIHGALTQEDRDKIVKEFKDGLTHVLISNDVFTRGFYQSKVNLVVNYDLPVVYDNPTEPDNEVYLHRVGRAGRFGRKGAVFNLLCGDGDDKIMKKIESHMNYVTEVPSWKSEEDIKDALKKADLL